MTALHRESLVIRSLSLFLLFGLLSLTAVRSQIVGDEICVEGFVMDQFCVEMGTLLDKPDLVSLQFPNEHSLHCLLDVKSCYESPFLILREPVAGSDMYTVAYQVDDSGRELLIALGREAGLAGNYPACQTCTNESENGLLIGFRAEVFGTITSDGVPPILTVSMAFVSNGRAASEICTSFASPMTNSPSTAPRLSAPVTTPTTQAPVTLMSPSPISEAPVTVPPVSRTASPSTITPATVPSSIPLSTSSIPSIRPVDSPSAPPSSLPVANLPLNSNSNSTPSSFPTASPFMVPSGGVAPPVASQNAPSASSSASPTVFVICRQHTKLHVVVASLILLITFY